MPKLPSNDEITRFDGSLHQKNEKSTLFFENLGKVAKVTKKVISTEVKEFFHRFHTACNSSHHFNIFQVAFFEISIKFSYLDTRILASYQLLATTEQNLSIVCSGKIKGKYLAFSATCQQEPISEKAHCCYVNCIWGRLTKSWPL